MIKRYISDPHHKDLKPYPCIQRTLSRIHRLALTLRKTETGYTVQLEDHYHQLRDHIGPIIQGTHIPDLYQEMDDTLLRAPVCTLTPRVIYLVGRPTLVTFKAYKTTQGLTEGCLMWHKGHSTRYFTGNDKQGLRCVIENALHWDTYLNEITNATGIDIRELFCQSQI